MSAFNIGFFCLIYLNVILSIAKDLLTTMRDSSVAEPAPSHRHEAVSRRESDILFALFHR